MRRSTDPIVKQIRRALDRLTLATVALFGLLVAIGVVGFIDATNKRDDIHDLAVRTTAALCTLRFNLDRRVRASEEFLKEHPQGIPGIPASVIQRSITEQRQTIDALEGLRCPPEDA